jgi:hypothetical protein
LHAQKSTSTTITTYAPFGSTTDETQKENNYDKNAIKWNLGLLTRGVFLLNYERVITDQFSLEAGVGITYQDFLFGISSDMDMTNSSPINNQSENIQTIKPGFALEISPRFYPQDSYMEGFYFAPFARIRQYNAMVTDPKFYNDSTRADQTIKGSQNLGHLSSDVGFMIGYQTDVSYWYNITWDYYFGVSYRTNSFKDIKYNGNTLTLIDKQNSIPTIIIGIKVGLYQF